MPFDQIWANENFPQKLGSVTFEPLCTPKLHAKYQKNLMSQFREKLVTNRWTDSTEFIGPSGYAGGPKKETKIKSNSSKIVIFSMKFEKCNVNDFTA